MLVDTSYRSQEVEMMDDLDMSGDLLIETLDKIANINHWLGGNKLTLNGVKELLINQTKSTPITIIDLGCGNGDMLRMLASFGQKSGYHFRLIGVDANRTTIEYAKQLSKKYDNINYHQVDIHSKEFNSFEYDIALSTLFLHHFESNTITNLVKQWANKATLGIVINDLHRHQLAYYLFKVVAFLFGNEMVKKDGLISILKGFKKHEFEEFAKTIGYTSSIQWKWAFRYQWIIRK